MSKNIAPPHPSTSKWLKDRKGKDSKKKSKRCTIKKQKSKINFANYLLGNRWNLVRTTHLKNNPKCLVCGNEFGLQVHHTKYDNLGKKQEFDDLVTLCGVHHKELHGFAMLNGLNIYDGSIEYVNSVKMTC